MISVEFLPLLLRWSAVIIIKKNKKLRKHHQVYGAITFQLLFFPPRCVHIPHRSCKFQLSAPVCFAEGGFQLNKCVAAVCDVAAAYSSSFLLSLAADGQLEVTTSAGVHSPPDMQPNTAWHKEKEVFFFFFCSTWTRASLAFCFCPVMCLCSLSWPNVVFCSDPHACIQHCFF